MKFKIRFADQIVGFFIVVALLSLVSVIFLLGSRQRWFSRDYVYKTYASSASGLNQNMPVLLRGMRVGSVKSFLLTEDDRVEVVFTVYDQYNNRVKEGSLIQILISPIGLGNQFVFHPGLGTRQLSENDVVPVYNSEAGRELIGRGLGFMPSQSDTIAIMMAKANTILDGLNKTLDEVNLAMTGDDDSVLGRTLTNVESISATVDAVLPSELAQIESITRDISVISAQLSGPEGVQALLGGAGTIITDLEVSVKSLSGILSDIKQSTAYLPREMPQLINLLTEVRTTLMTAEEVLVALRNNPLLKNGIPEHMETDTSGTNPRDVRF
ncbi:MAG: MlaD family protein [Treponema sp.]|jgi:phospholipid/cholesterol/gamma-HCH transport system substrate-binding protein|nr:MlaD family protein [Treponema sp.]